MNRYVLVNFARTLRTSWRIYAMAVFMTAVAYGISGAFFLLHRNVTLTTRFWVRSVPVTLVLERGLTPAEGQALVDRARIEGASGAKIITPEEGRKRLEESLHDARLFEGFDENPLPPMLEMNFEAPPPAAHVALMRAWPRVVEVDDAGRWSERFRALLRVLDRTGAALGLVLVAAAFAVASLGVRLVAANHTQEIEIQRLVGAPPGFIRAPYLLAGAALGLAGAAFAAAGLAALHWAASSVPAAGWPIPIHRIVFFSPVELLALGGGAVAVGLLGSWVGLRGEAVG